MKLKGTSDNSVKWLVISLALITFAELSLLDGIIAGCIFFHGVNLIYIVLLSILKNYEYDSRAVSTLVLPSTFRLANLAMPVFFLLKTYWLAMVYLTLFPAVYYVAKALNLSGKDMGFTSKYWYLIFPALLVGFLLGIVEKKIFSVTFNSPVITILIVMFMFVALGEELMYRSVIQGYLEREIGFWSVLVSSYVNAIMMPTLKLVAFAFPVAVLLGLIFRKTENVWINVALHGAMCFAMVVGLSFQI